MKANRKFVEGTEAVSAVIGVILMVAITVAIAATVYVYVTQMMPSDGDATPTLALSQDAAVDEGDEWVNFTVHQASSDARWDDLEFSVGGTNCGIPDTDHGKDITTGQTAPDSWYNGSNKPIKADDTLFLYVGSGLESGDTLKVIHKPSNSIIVQKTIN